MDKFVLVCDGSQADGYVRLMELFEEILHKESYEWSRLYIQSGSPTEYIEVLEAAEYVCVIDLAGSQIRTLLDDSVYNVLRAKQIHFIADTSVLKVYKMESMALNLYLFLPENEKKYINEFEHIPNLLTYPILEKDEKGRPVDSPNNREVIRMVCKRFWDDVKN
ncbi:MAG: hypothetical protein E7288_08715 [Lachnospiraceae bacterium]|nr:hypothetical protein [Lachnospiraceae bacterium]